MKILIINDHATWTGGAEILTLAMRDGLRSRGHDARILASSDRPLNAEVLADYKCFGTSSRFRTLLQTANLSAVWQLCKVLAEFQPDVVHVNMFLMQISPLILPLLKDIPCLYYVVSHRPLCPQGIKMLPDGTNCQNPVGFACFRHHCLPLHAWLPHMLQMKLWRHWRDAFNLTVTNSEAMKHRLIAEGIEVAEVVWHGVPIHLPRPPLVSPPTVVFAGRLSWEKGVDVLVRAFAKVVSKIPLARLLLAGDGPQRDAIASLIVELGLSQNVSVLGFLSHPEMELHFATGWVQVVPSRWAEPFGMVAIEAMMRGSAVVASNSGGLVEIVRHGETGFLVPPGEIDALESALLRLLQNRELAEQMGRAGREVAIAEFSVETFVDKFVELYQTLYSNSGRKVNIPGHVYLNSKLPET